MSIDDRQHERAPTIGRDAVAGGAPRESAQEGAAAQDMAVDETRRLISSEKVSGTDVRRPNGDLVGAIEHLMIDKTSGRVAYAVMSFGGILGIGESRRPVPWDALRYNPELDAYELDTSDDQLRSAPAYVDSENFDWTDVQWNEDTRTHYGVGVAGAT